ASSTAVRCGCESAAVALGRSAPPDAIRAGLIAADDALRSGEGATTLVVAVIDGGGGLWASRIGDSTILLVTEDDGHEVFAANTDDDLVTVSTAALPFSAGNSGREIDIVEMVHLEVPVTATVVLATDGIAEPWRDGPTTVAPSLALLATARPSALELTAWADFSRAGCHDDRTLVMLWRRPVG
ncbi:MAG: protein phosphatase 2C domain-containing protein, partial [Actinomycetota bacterium]|nr:protein phosphatase 2C domain-containing protein [Actinomycetota bacterium]